MLVTGALVIVGCGGFGREVFSLVEALRQGGEEWAVEGFVDDNPSDLDLARVAELGSSVVGEVADLARRSEPVAAVIAIGSATARTAITAQS